MPLELDIAPIVKGRRVAIVGHASSIRGQNYGAEIDGHEVVVRCNLLDIPPGWEPDMGSKCSLWYSGDSLLAKENAAHLQAGHKLGVPICGKKPKMMQRIHDWLDPLSANSEKIRANTWSCTGIVAVFDCLLSGAASVSVYGFDFFRSADIHGEGVRTDPEYVGVLRSLDNDLARLRILWLDGHPVRYDAVLDDLVRGGGMSVIISAYGTPELLRRCLDAFLAQTNRAGIKIELLVGSDGCDACRKVLAEYRPHVSAWHFPRNHGGPYIPFNTLAKKARYSHLVFFGADDVPDPGFTDEIARLRDAKDIIRLAFRNEAKPDHPATGAIGHAHGSFALSARDFDRLGGYQPWPCAADTEFLWRSRQMRMSQTFAAYGQPVFTRGIHDDQLTAVAATGMQSEKRTGLAAMIGKTTGRIEPETDECEAI